MSYDDACRMCLEAEPRGDLIRCCNCSGSVRLVHRECLDRWRSISPHPDAMVACELCKTKFKLILKDDGGDCWRNTRYAAAVVLDLTVFIALFAGLYLLVGFLGDLSLTNLLKGIPQVIKTLPFLNNNLWAGRIWFWGFILFFCILGICGCLAFCCFRDEGADYNDNSHHSFNNTSCWWIMCGPTYYNGYYYYSPYGYWGPGDLFCFYWFCAPRYHYHTPCIGCCDGGSCSNTNSCSNLSEGSGNNGLAVILIIVAIVVLIFVVVGVFVGSLIAFLFVNKVLKRHLNILEREASTQKYIVCNLDDPTEVAEAERTEGLVDYSELTEVITQSYDVNNADTYEPLNKDNNKLPKGKEFDLY